MPRNYATRKDDGRLLPAVRTRKATAQQRALRKRYEELLGVIHTSSHKVRFERGELIIYWLDEQGGQRDLAKVLLLPGDLAEALSAPKRRPRRRT